MYMKINNLSFKYENSNFDNLNNINMEIKKGEIIGVLGESGCGKSTLLRVIAGLEIPYIGNIIINDKIVMNQKVFIEPEKRGIGMIFQDYALFPHMTIDKNITFGLRKFSKKDKKNILDNMIELVGLKDHLGKYPYQLSGGQQQRVAVARALAPNPSILLLDEPFSNLDSHLKNQIRMDMKEILNKLETTCIFVTHDKEDVLSLSNRVITISDGLIKDNYLVEKMVDIL
ncbi:MAG: ABC transporter ATP-binding protein [Oscillospiraceae bacterium]|nr:ABC transporter ATP-binding protein [Oscillospiraceae bacterium]